MWQTQPDSPVFWGYIVSTVVLWVKHEKQVRGQLLEDMVGEYLEKEKKHIEGTTTKIKKLVEEIRGEVRGAPISLKRRNEKNLRDR
jgi:hypothetical protein